MQTFACFPIKINPPRFAGRVHLLIRCLSFGFGVEVDAGEQHAAKVLHTLELKQPPLRTSFEVNDCVGEEEIFHHALGQERNFCSWHIPTQIAWIRRGVEEKNLNKGATTQMK